MSVGDLDEGAELGEVAHLALDDRALGERVGQLLPGVALGLAQRQADAPAVHIELRDDRLDLVVDAEHLGRIDDLLGPRHLADVDEALDPFFDLDEGTVVHQADHPTVDPRTDGVLLVHQGPGILALLLVAEGDTLGLRDRI